MTVAFQNNIAHVLDKMDLISAKDFINGHSGEKILDVLPRGAEVLEPKVQRAGYHHLSFGRWLINGLRNDMLGPVVVFSSILCTVPVVFVACGYLLHTTFTP